MLYILSGEQFKQQKLIITAELFLKNKTTGGKGRMKWLKHEKFENKLTTEIFAVCKISLIRMFSHQFFLPININSRD